MITSALELLLRQLLMCVCLTTRGHRYSAPKCGESVGASVPAKQTCLSTMLSSLLPLGRRALVTSLLTGLALPGSGPALAAGPALAPLQEAQAKLRSVDDLLKEPARWPEASAILKAPPLQESTLTRLFEAAVDQPTTKDRLMDQAAFIVYYEEVRYNDKRLEPVTPSRRAEQNGLKKEVLRAVADELAEVDFLIKQSGTTDDAAELRAYSANAQRALGEFLALTSGTGGGS